MAVLLIYPLLAIGMVSLDYRVTSYNETPINGYGGIWYVVRKEARPPMRYRVLLPWLYALVFWMLGGEEDPPDRLIIYLFLKWAFMSSTMMVAAYFFSHAIALMLALYWMLVLQYDYWSVYVEALAFLLVLTGNIWLALLGAIVGSLGKETAVILPFVFLSVGGEWLTVPVAVLCWSLLGAVRMYQGRHESAEKTLRKPINTAFKYIWKRKVWRRYLITGWAAIAISLIVAMHFNNMMWPFRSTAWVPVVMSIAGFFGAIVHEPRVFAVNVIWWGALLT